MTIKGNPLYLLKDTVHALKAIRNNWITEKTKMFDFQLPHDRITRTANWHCVEELYRKSAEDIIKLSPLNYSAIYLRPIENVKLELKCLGFGVGVWDCCRFEINIWSWGRRYSIIYLFIYLICSEMVAGCQR